MEIFLPLSWLERLDPLKSLRCRAAALEKRGTVNSEAPFLRGLGGSRASDFTREPPEQIKAIFLF
jgi:hypothetical protein